MARVRTQRRQLPRALPRGFVPAKTVLSFLQPQIMRTHLTKEEPRCLWPCTTTNLPRLCAHRASRVDGPIEAARQPAVQPRRRRTSLHQSTKTSLAGNTRVSWPRSRGYQRQGLQPCAVLVHIGLIFAKLDICEADRRRNPLRCSSCGHTGDDSNSLSHHFYYYRLYGARGHHSSVHARNRKRTLEPDCAGSILDGHPLRII